MSGYFITSVRSRIFDDADIRPEDFSLLAKTPKPYFGYYVDRLYYSCDTGAMY
jgi:hypothetical protein